MKKVFALFPFVMFFSLSFAAGAGEWKAVYAKTVFANPETGEIRQAIFVDEKGSTTQLTSDAEYNTLPSWSPAGNEIVFAGPEGIGIMNADGTNRRALGIIGRFPTMSRTHVVYEAPKVDNTFVWAAPIDGSSPPLALTMGGEPDVSFDGTKVSITNAEAGAGTTFINIDGTGERWVADGEEPKFLPDGRIVVLRDKAQAELWGVDPETGEDHFLAMGREHSVSNDGWIVYAKILGPRGWYAIRPDGTEDHLIDPDLKKGGFQVYGDLTPNTGGDPAEEPRAVLPQGKLTTQWARLKVGE